MTNGNETRAAVVTGASSGIGRAIALELARGGADVLVHARRSQSAAEETADRVRQLGRQAHVVLCDLSDPAQHERLVDHAWAWRPIHTWVNNAGADVLTGAAAHWPFERKLAELWTVDVVATMRLSRLAGLRMQADAGVVDRQDGCPTPSILSIGWDQAEHGMAGDSGELFAATKGAIMAFTRSLAKSLAPQVRVNCLAPGWIKTAWGERASAAWQERAVRESLLARWGTPEDVARAARFLTSEEAGFITGQIVPVNGGLRG